MNFLMLGNDEVVAGRAVLRGARAREVMERHELKEGVRVAAGILGGLLGTVRVERCSNEEIELVGEFQNAPPARSGVTIVVAVPRPPTVKKILHLAAASGIEAVHFVRTDEVVPSYLQSKMLREESIKAGLVLGLEQAGDTVLPKVTVHGALWEFLTQANLPTTRVMMDGRATSTLGEVVRRGGVAHEMVVAFGPEKGWSERERVQLQKHGFVGVSLGDRMHRLENAISMTIGGIFALRCLVTHCIESNTTGQQS